MKRIAVLLVLMGSFALASTASAQPYVTGKLGVYLPDHNWLDDGFNLEGAYGRPFGDFFADAVRHQPWLRNVNLEASVGFYTADYSRRSGRSGSVQAVPVTVSALYNHALNQQFDVYGGAGLGVAVVSDDWGSNGLRVGPRLIAGGYYNLTPQFALGAELRHDVYSGRIGGSFLNFGARFRL
jgi:opacity protein-like surface antigen